MEKERLLKKAGERYLEQMAADSERDTILAVLRREKDETHTHSRLLAYLLQRSSGGKFTDSYLFLFLREIGVPECYLQEEKWIVYRERTFDRGRIDFVIESSDYVIAIEMKIGNGDGSHQLERYERFLKSRRKEYGLYYLTPDGKEPEKQSVGGLDADRLHCISFEREILSWLKECLVHTEQGSYRYSYIHQYMGTVKRIVTGKREASMKDLIQDSKDAFAVIELCEGLEELVSELLQSFIEKLLEYVKEHTKREWELYNAGGEDIKEYFRGYKRIYPGFYTVLDRKQIGTMEYRFFFYVELGDYFYMGFGFDRKKRNGNEEDVLLDFMKKKDRDFFDRCTEKVRKLDIRDMHYGTAESYWVKIENTNGELLNFKNWYNFRGNSSVLSLIDDMEIQVEYIGDYIVNGVLKRLESW